MDKGNSRNEDDLDYKARWPQRPGRGQADEETRLDEEVKAADSAWTATPTTHKSVVGGEDDPKETRLLPVVEPSRFDIGRPPARPQARPQPPQPQQPQQTQPRPRPETASGAVPRVQVERPAPDYDDDTAQYGPGGYAMPAYEYSLRAAPAVQPQAPARPRRKLPRWVGWTLWTLAGIVGIALIGAIAFSLAWQGQYAGKIYAGVSALDTDLSGKSKEEASRLLREKVQTFLAQPVVLAWRGKEWRPNSEQIGLNIDIDRTVDDAFLVGRGSDMAQNVSQQWISSQAGYVVPLTVELSEPKLEEYLKSIAEAEIDQELFEGDVRLNGTEIQAQPGTEGRALRVYDTIVAIRDQIARLEPARIELPIEHTEPSVSAQEIQYVEGLLGIRISGPITATTPGKVLALDRDAIVRFTTIERNPDRSAERHIELGWKENELKTLAERWASEANRPAQNARFAWNDGAVQVLSESVTGFETAPDAIIASIKEHADTSDRREYGLPGTAIPAKVSSNDVGSLGIKELMGTGLSTFKGSSQERATNISVAANLLNGAVIPPGATFSFLETMGGIDEAHGFVEGYVIAAERTQRGVGGGVCQVSTTAFRAAFRSGLAITERHQHSYRVGWYEANGEPVGFDAAVFDPGVDLKFVNESPNYVLIQAIVSNETLAVNMYGTKSPGEVRLEGPAISNRVPPPPDVYEVDTRLPAGTKKQVETARGGLDTVITRRIVTPGQPDKVDQFHSSYAAWPNYYIVASRSQIPGGSATEGAAVLP